MIFSAGGAVAFAGVFVTQAGQLVAAAHAIAVAGFRCGLDGNQRHNKRIIRFRGLPRKRRREDRANWHFSANSEKADPLRQGRNLQSLREGQDEGRKSTQSRSVLLKEVLPSLMTCGNSYPPRTSKQKKAE